MSRINKPGLILAVYVALLSQVQADSLYKVDASELVGVTLFDQELLENGLVTVVPSVGADSRGDLSIMDQCLWSVDIRFRPLPVTLTPGKMICVGPQQEVLETIPSGTIEALGVCVEGECTAYTLTGGTEFHMRLESPLSFTLQPRNERQ